MTDKGDKSLNERMEELELNQANIIKRCDKFVTFALFSWIVGILIAIGSTAIAFTNNRVDKANDDLKSMTQGWNAYVTQSNEDHAVIREQLAEIKTELKLKH